jgi:toxin ParE1/3/4
VTPEPSYAPTDEADADLDRILTESARRFGAAQCERYTALIRAAILKVAALPERLGSRDWSDLEPGLRSYPVALAARRRGAAVHILFY